MLALAATVGVAAMQGTLLTPVRAAVPKPSGEVRSGRLASLAAPARLARPPAAPSASSAPARPARAAPRLENPSNSPAAGGSTPVAGAGTVNPSLQVLDSFPADSEVAQIASAGSDQAGLPGDPSLGVGPGWVVEATNSYLGYWAKDPAGGTGGAPTQSVDLDQFLTGSNNLNPNYSQVSAPEILYDQLAQRWLLAAVVFDPSNGNSDLALAMSTSSNPAGDWAIYNLPPYLGTGTSPPTPEYGYLADQPRVGYSSDAVLISWGAYSGTTYTGSVLWALDAAEMASASALGNAAYSESGSSGPQFAVAPASAQTPTATAYAAYTQQLTSPDDRLGVISFSGTPSASNFQFLEQDLAVNALATPPVAVQPQAGVTLATGDNRVLSSVWANNALWLDANDACVPAGDSTTRSCLRLISVSTATTPAQVGQDFDQGLSGAYTYFPSLALDGAGDLFVSFGESSATIDPSAEALLIPSTELSGSAPPADLSLASVGRGAAPYFPSCGSACQSQGAYRWGQYSGAAADSTSPGQVWVVGDDTQAAPGSGCPTASSASGATGCWSTAIGELGLPSTYTPLPPARILDTRSGSGEPGAGQRLGAGSVIGVQVEGQGGVPARGVSAVALNVTVTDTGSPGYLSAYPSGSALPLVSNLNWSGAGTVANLVMVPVGPDGQVDFFNDVGTADLVVDAEGYFSPYLGAADAGSYVPLTPRRITDTRSGSGEPYSGQTLHPGATLDIQAAGVGGVPALGVTAVLLNVTVTDTSAASYLTAFPAGSAQPLASNLNWPQGDTVANRVVVPVNPSSGRITVYNQLGDTDVVVDVDGYFTDSTGSGLPANASLFFSLPGTRVLDTRITGPVLTPGATLTEPLLGVAGVPPGASAVVANVTAVDPTAASYLTVFPDDGPSTVRPTASDLNWSPGQTIPNFTLITVGSTGSTEAFNALGKVGLLIDVSGYFEPG